LSKGGEEGCTPTPDRFGTRVVQTGACRGKSKGKSLGRGKKEPRGKTSEILVQ